MPAVRNQNITQHVGVSVQTKRHGVVGEVADAPGTKMVISCRVRELETLKRRRQDWLWVSFQLFEDLRES